MVWLAPSQIRFTQDTIHSELWGRKNVNTTIDDIASGLKSAHSFQNIKVAKRDGKYYSLDNRRLYVFRVLEKMGKLKEVEVNMTCWESSKFTTKDDGHSVRVRFDETRDHTFENLLPPPSPPAKEESVIDNDSTETSSLKSEENCNDESVTVEISTKHNDENELSVVENNEIKNGEHNALHENNTDETIENESSDIAEEAKANPKKADKEANGIAENQEPILAEGTSAEIKEESVTESDLHEATENQLTDVIENEPDKLPTNQINEIAKGNPNEIKADEPGGVKENKPDATENIQPEKATLMEPTSMESELGPDTECESHEAINNEPGVVADTENKQVCDFQESGESLLESEGIYAKSDTVAKTNKSFLKLNENSPESDVTLKESDGNSQDSDKGFQEPDNNSQLMDNISQEPDQNLQDSHESFKESDENSQEPYENFQASADNTQKPEVIKEDEGPDILTSLGIERNIVRIAMQNRKYYLLAEGESPSDLDDSHGGRTVWKRKDENCSPPAAKRRKTDDEY